MTAYDTAAFILFYLWVAAMILAFLWTVRELWRMFVELANDEPHRPLEKGTGDATEECECNAMSPVNRNFWMRGKDNERA